MLVAPSRFRRLCQARDLLADLDSAVTIHHAARAAGLSPFHFIRRFEALFGATPRQFRIQRRMDRAQFLLASTSATVTEVCFEVGMESLGSFSSAFVRHVGQTPSQYQRQARRLVAVVGYKDDFPPALFPGCLSLMAALPRRAFE